MRIFQKLCYRLRERVLSLVNSPVRKAYWRAQGMVIGARTACPAVRVTWPHQVRIGSECMLEPNIYFKFDGIWQPGPSIIIGNHCFIGTHCEFNICKRVTIGNHCLIASGVRFIDADHGTDRDRLIRVQPAVKREIVVGDDVWIGANAVILKGVTLGHGCIVAAGAVVTKPVAPYAIVAGVPAKQIGQRRSLPADALDRGLHHPTVQPAVTGAASC